MSDFQNFVTIWGSDGVVEKFFRFRVSSTLNPPAMITMRLTSDLLLSIRRDIALPDTKLNGGRMIGARIRGWTEHPEFEYKLTMPLGQLCKEEKWVPPFKVDD